VHTWLPVGYVAVCCVWMIFDSTSAGRSRLAFGCCRSSAVISARLLSTELFVEVRLLTVRLWGLRIILIN